MLTIKAVKVIVDDYISKQGLVTTGQSLRIIENHTHFGLSRSTIRNIFSMIMADMVAAGRAEKSHRGAWIILKENKPAEVVLGSGGLCPQFVKKEYGPVTFNPQLNAWLNPPKPTPEVDVYNELKKLKGAEKTRWQDHAIVLCMKAGVSLTKLINYINEQREVRTVQAAGVNGI